MKAGGFLMPNIILALAGVTALVTAITTLYVTIKNGGKINQVHELVNSRMTLVLNRVDQLTAALIKAGIEVPLDPDDPTGEKKRGI